MGSALTWHIAQEWQHQCTMQSAAVSTCSFHSAEEAPMRTPVASDNRSTLPWTTEKGRC